MGQSQLFGGASDFQTDQFCAVSQPDGIRNGVAKARLASLQHKPHKTNDENCAFKNTTATIHKNGSEMCAFSVKSTR